MKRGVPEFDSYPYEPSSETLDENGDLEFVCVEKYHEVIPYPTPVQAHFTEETKNFQYNTSVNQKYLSQMQSIPGVSDGVSRGYIVPMPATVAIVEEQEGVYAQKTQFTMDDGFIQPQNDIDDSRMDPIFRYQLYWIPKVPDGYALFCTKPHFLNDDSYSVVTQIIDPSIGLSQLYVDVIVHDAPVKFKYGFPMLQVIPVSYSTLNVETVIEK